MRISLKTVVVLALFVAGCSSMRPALTVEMNGRKLEFETFRGGKVPRGFEVPSFGPGNIQLVGDQAIEVNGMSVVVQGDSFTVGGRTVSADKDAQVFVRSNGEIQVLVPPKPPKPAQPAAGAK